LLVLVLELIPDASLQGHRTIFICTLGTMVPHFAYWSIGSFLHRYESHLTFIPVLYVRPES